MTPQPVNIAIGQGSTLPVLTATILTATGTPMTLVGASVKFVMRTLQTAKPKIDATATVVTPAAGSVRYAWTATDTATAGLFMGQFIVTTSGAATYAFPNGGYLTIEVDASLVSAPVELVSLSDAKSVLNIPATDYSRDEKVLRYIEAARTAIEDIVGPVIPQQFNEWYDGGQNFISLRRRPTRSLNATPLITLQAISEYAGPIEWPLQIIATPDEGQLYSAMLTVAMGRVVRRTAGGGVQSFPSMPQSVHVIYTAGLNEIPAGIYEGTLELIRINFQQTQQGPPKFGASATYSDSVEPTTGPPAFFVPNRVRQMIGSKRKHPAIA